MSDKEENLRVDVLLFKKRLRTFFYNKKGTQDGQDCAREYS